MRLENLSYEGESVREGFIEDENGNLIPNDVPLPLSYSITELPNSSLGIIKDASGNAIEADASITLATLRGLQFEPNPNTNTGQEYGTFKFTVSDGLSEPTVETVFIHILAVNDNPTAPASSTAIGTTNEDETFVFSSNDLVDGFTDIDNPTNELRVISGSVNASNGEISFDHPPANTHLLPTQTSAVKQISTL